MAAAKATKNKTRHPAKRQVPSSSVKRSIKKPKARGLNLRIGRATLQVSLKIATKKTPPKKKKKTTKKKPNSSSRTASRKSRLSLAALLILMGAASSAYFGMQVFAATSLEPLTPSSVITKPQAVTETVKQPVTLPASDAVKLQIPDIQLDTEVISVGRNGDDSLQVPSDYRVAGQYRFGPTPGELGPSVIVGHVSSYKGAGVFRKLREVQPNQIINVLRADGSTAAFRVTQIKNFSQDAFPTTEVYGNLDHSGLRLITCGGAFSVFSRSYSENTVVFATLVAELSTGFATDAPVPEPKKMTVKKQQVTATPKPAVGYAVDSKAVLKLLTTK